MIKKIIFMVFAMSFINAFADDASSVTAQRPLNNPSIGSRQSSDQIFGNPKLTGQKGQVYYTKEQMQNRQNNPAKGSANPSNQIFGEPKLTGQKGQSYYSQEQMQNRQNNPVKGSVSPSNQIFGFPGESKPK